jgi:aquaporin Z
MFRTLRAHWPEFTIEAVGLALFMMSAGLCATLLESPDSSVHRELGQPAVRRLIMGLAMGLTAVGLIYSPWGKQSGAHLNPAVTLTFVRLGKVGPWDGLFYILAQFAGGWVGVTFVCAILGCNFL